VRFLVTAATGRTSAGLVRHLRAADEEVRGLVRDKDTATRTFDDLHGVDICRRRGASRTTALGSSCRASLPVTTPRRLDECGRVVSLCLDCIRGLTAGAGNASVVEQNDRTIPGQSASDCWIPVVHAALDMTQE
jgi:hypothetical protein